MILSHLAEESHMIYDNFCLSVYDLNSNNLISFPLVLCFQASSSLTGWHCSVTVKATLLPLYFPLKVSGPYSTTHLPFQIWKGLT